MGICVRGLGGGGGVYVCDIYYVCMGICVVFFLQMVFTVYVQ